MDEYDWPADDNLPRWHWFIKTPQLPPDARPFYSNPQVMEAETLDERSMLTTVDHVLDDPCEAPDGKRLAWTEMRVDHTWARLPEPDRHMENNEVRIDDHDNKPRRLLVPLKHTDGHIWATTPKPSTWDPFLLSVKKSCGTVYPDGLEYDAGGHHCLVTFDRTTGRNLMTPAVSPQHLRDPRQRH
ncbi:hypothetical protein [Streptomyces chattanoogensis]|uniref:hypothetical protein n=1 Tax=Streptomyces chattanoogensis TaxID=66876 RepID=UPI0036AA5553